MYCGCEHYTIYFYLDNVIVLCIICTPQKEANKHFLDQTYFKVAFSATSTKAQWLVLHTYTSTKAMAWNLHCVIPVVPACATSSALSRHIFLPIMRRKWVRRGGTLCLHLDARSIQLQMWTQMVFLVTHTPVKNLQGPSLHIWTSDVERNSDVKLVWHGLSFHQPKLPNMITMVCCVYYIRIVQFTCFNQRIVNLKKTKTKHKIHSTE